MTTPVKTLILRNVATTLGGVTIAAGYHQDLTVYDRPISFSEIGNYPCVFIRDAGELKDGGQAVGYTKCDLIFALEVLVADNGDPALALDQVMADIEQVLDVDPTRGGYAIDTNQDGPAECIIWPDQTPSGGGFQDYKVEYMHKRGNPYSQ